MSSAVSELDELIQKENEVFIDYLLMNKDNEIASFSVGNLDYPEDVKQLNVLPKWLTDISGFIMNRRPPKHRANIEELLELSGCNTLKGYLDVSHALSLIDTFWVKRKDSNLDWNTVSLYKNPFNEVIARTAFEGGMHGRQFNTTSPEYGTDGSFPKCWVREDGVPYLIKGGSSGASNAGLEPISEFYASQIVDRLSNNSVVYDLVRFGSSNKWCSKCRIFTSESYGYLPYSAINVGNTTFGGVLQKCSELGFIQEVKDMFVIDSVIMNEDRHTNNFGFLFDTNTYDIVGFAPLFDFNISMLTYAMDDDLRNIDKYMLSLNKGPRIGNSLTPSMKRVLRDNADFKFIRKDIDVFSSERVDVLEKRVKKNIKDILS